METGLVGAAYQKLTLQHPIHLNYMETGLIRAAYQKVAIQHPIHWNEFSQILVVSIQNFPMLYGVFVLLYNPPFLLYGRCFLPHFIR